METARIKLNQLDSEPGEKAIFICLLTGLVFWSISTVMNPLKAPLTSTALSDLVATVVLFFLFLRTRIEQQKQWIVFLAIVLFSVGSVINHQIYIEHQWQILHSYVGIKIVAFILAISAAPIAMAPMLSFIVLGLTPLIQYFFLTRNQSALLGLDEPWLTAGFVSCASLIWIYRRYSLLLKRTEVAREAQADLFKNFLHLLLGAQHLMNTPLQNISANVHLIGMDFPGAEPRIKAIERAFSVVRQVGTLIAFSESQIRWEPTDIPADIEDLSKLVQKISKEISSAGGAPI